MNAVSNQKKIQKKLFIHFFFLFFLVIANNTSLFTFDFLKWIMIGRKRSNSLRINILPRLKIDVIAKSITKRRRQQISTHFDAAQWSSHMSLRPFVLCLWCE